MQNTGVRFSEDGPDFVIRRVEPPVEDAAKGKGLSKGEKGKSKELTERGPYKSMYGALGQMSLNEGDSEDNEARE